MLNLNVLVFCCQLWLNKHSLKDNLLIQSTLSHCPRYPAFIILSTINFIVCLSSLTEGEICDSFQILWLPFHTLKFLHCELSKHQKGRLEAYVRLWVNHELFHQGEENLTDRTNVHQETHRFTQLTKGNLYLQSIIFIHEPSSVS